MASCRLSIGTERRRGRPLHERQFDAQHPVLVARDRLFAAHVRAKLDHPPKRSAHDLDLLVDVAVGARWSAHPGDDQRPSLDLELQVGYLDPGQIGRDDRQRGLRCVRDVDRRPPPRGASGQARALEHVTEQLVHLAAHAIEVREQIALGHLS